jgi:hypothetical protein
MDTHRSNDLSRRTMLLGIGAGGLAAALGTPKVEPAYAQVATPRGGTSLPEGVGFISLSSVPIRDLPTEPFTIVVSRVTLEPGAVVPNTAVPYPAMVYVEKGEGVICPPGGEGRFITDAEGNLVNSGGDEMAFPQGTWCYTTPNTMDGVRNDGTDQASGLSLELVPSKS